MADEKKSTAEPKVMRSVIKEKKYYLITHPDLPGWRVENYGDREFTLIRSDDRCWQTCHGSISGDVNWEINENNILMLADRFLIDQIEEEAKEKKEVDKTGKSKSPRSLFDEVFGHGKGDSLFERIFG